MTESPSAGNGLLNRRRLLQMGSAVGVGAILSPVAAEEPWLRRPGAPSSDYGQPSHRAHLVRERVNAHPFGPAAGSSSTPLQSLNGTITPNSLHFERHHSGAKRVRIDSLAHEMRAMGRLSIVTRRRTWSTQPRFFCRDRRENRTDSNRRAHLQQSPAVQKAVTGRRRFGHEGRSPYTVARCISRGISPWS